MYKLNILFKTHVYFYYTHYYWWLITAYKPNNIIPAHMNVITNVQSVSVTWCIIIGLI